MAPSDRALLWQPNAAQRNATQVMALARALEAAHGQALPDYRALHRFSIEHPGAFWEAVWDHGGVIAERRGAIAVEEGDRMPGARFFPEARLNYAENLLRRHDDGDALVFRAEDQVERRLSWRALQDLVSRLQQFFLAAGVTAGDRVAAMMPNMPETIAAMLACTSLGAIFTSCSPDFGEQGVLDRFGQIAPKVFVTCDGYVYNGKRIEIATKLQHVVERLPSVERVLVVPLLGQADAVAASLPRAMALEEALAPFSAGPIRFERMAFNTPLFILYSSGTTGAPKCIVHGAGGTLLQHIKEHRFQCDIRPGDRVFYFTTCGWMMWNWLASALASEATLLLYDGSPLVRNEILFDFLKAEQATMFGTSAKYIDTVRKSGWVPKTTHALPSVRLITSTGSPLSADGFTFVYEGIKDDVPLVSFAGGTDIISCFVGGDPTGPVYVGEIQAPGLGMAVDVWDDDGQPAGVGVKGELVCTRPFPSMPVQFWNDPGDAKYRAAYFERFPNVWCHGDFAEWTEAGGMIIHGRSDATLNPGGVRIGTAELYAQVEKVDEVLEALAIGQTWDDDVRVVLFVRLRPGVPLDEALVARLKRQIREGASPRHVPAKIIAVADIPRTKSGKIVELAVRDIVHGRPVKNREALANPEALDLFAGIEELAR